MSETTEPAADPSLAAGTEPLDAGRSLAAAAEPLAPIPDDKDWTWVLSRVCPECGYTGDTAAADIASTIRGTVDAWGQVLTAGSESGELAKRPEPQVWSPLEYACHVSDVYDIFTWRLALMLDQDNPTFANWDQDESALNSRYWERDPAEVAVELRERGLRYADAYARVAGDQWERGGSRSNGSKFTVYSQGIYGLHDILHHLHDVGAGHRARS